MIVYVDTSALVKLYIAETGSADVAALASNAASLGTAIVTRAEAAAAFGKAARIGAAIDGYSAHR